MKAFKKRHTLDTHLSEMCEILLKIQIYVNFKSVNYF